MDEEILNLNIAGLSICFFCFYMDYGRGAPVDFNGPM
jgi:hypothetical protein